MEHTYFWENRYQKLKAMATRIRLLTAVFLFLTSTFLFFTSCASKPTNLKAIAPNETLIYLETQDLGVVLQSLTEGKAFKESAVKSKDFSSVKGVQLAIAITGFETSEKQVTDQNAILNFKPRLVAIADTHLWGWQTRTFAEEVLGNFVNETYGGEVNLDLEDKDGGTMYVWTALDQRKAYAFVKDSQIVFSNDQTSIEKCLAVKRGDAESLLKNESLRRAFDANAANKLAFGYVSSDGIAQIANLAGVSAAIEATEEDGGRSFIARVLPQILRNTTKEVVWTATRTESGIEDKYTVELDKKYSTVFNETFAVSANNAEALPEFLPSDIFTTSKYSLKNPLIAWRSLLLVTKETTDAASGSLLQQFSNGLLASYGVSDAELFLSSIEAEIFTAQFDADGDKSVTIVAIKDKENVKKSLSDIIDFKASAEIQNDAEIWHSKEKRISAAFAGNSLILGDAESVLKCLEAKRSGQNFAKTPSFAKLSEDRSTAITFGKSIDASEKIVGVLGDLKEGNKGSVSTFLTKTVFTEKGVERKSVSDFGFIGMILEQIEE